MPSPIPTKLRELAEAATRGPWKANHDPAGCAVVSYDSAPRPMHVASDIERGDNADFIAAANPATVLALLDAIDLRDPVRAADQLVALGQEVDDLRAELREMTAQMAELLKERDGARATVKRVERECGRLMSETRDDDSEHGLSTGSAAGRVIMAVRAPHLLDGEEARHD